MPTAVRKPGRRLGRLGNLRALVDSIGHRADRDPLLHTGVRTPPETGWPVPSQRQRRGHRTHSS